MEIETLRAISTLTGSGAALFGLLSVGLGVKGIRAVWNQLTIEPNDLIDLLGYLLWLGFGIAAVIVGGLIIFGKGVVE
jgi:hypothetical protein